MFLQVASVIFEPVKSIKSYQVNFQQRHLEMKRKIKIVALGRE